MGVRGEQAMTFAVAAIQAKEVNTRKAAVGVLEIGGLDSNSPHSSRDYAKTNEQLGDWQNHPAREITYIILDAWREKVGG